MGVWPFDFTIEFPAMVYEASHPAVTDSVMNYDGRKDEPDCSPHPLDIMAIYALYQTVP